MFKSLEEDPWKMMGEVVVVRGTWWDPPFPGNWRCTVHGFALEWSFPDGVFATYVIEATGEWAGEYYPIRDHELRAVMAARQITAAGLDDDSDEADGPEDEEDALPAARRQGRRAGAAGVVYPPNAPRPGDEYAKQICL